MSASGTKRTSTPYRERQILYVTTRAGIRDARQTTGTPRGRATTTIDVASEEGGHLKENFVSRALSDR